MVVPVSSSHHPPEPLTRGRVPSIFGIVQKQPRILEVAISNFVSGCDTVLPVVEKVTVCLTLPHLYITVVRTVCQKSSTFQAQ